MIAWKTGSHDIKCYLPFVGGALGEGYERGLLLQGVVGEEGEIMA